MPLGLIIKNYSVHELHTQTFMIRGLNSVLPKHLKKLSFPLHSTFVLHEKGDISITLYISIRGELGNYAI